MELDRSLSFFDVFVLCCHKLENELLVVNPFLCFLLELHLAFISVDVS